MTETLRIIAAQCNPVVGDIEKNLRLHIKLAETARDVLHADVIVFPELSLTGYSPEDLLYRQDFLHAAERALEALRQQIQGIYFVVGHPLRQEKKLFNACSLIHNEKIIHQYCKQHLPNYSVFDECRYFSQGKDNEVILINNIPVSLLICEDIWFPGPVARAAANGAKVILSPNASPFELHKHEQRTKNLATRASTENVAIIYANLTGGQDELVFDGGSMAVDPAGTVCKLAGFFNETLMTVDVAFSEENIKIESAPFALPDLKKRVYDALVMGTRDYLHKNNFKAALVGVSGGIDSALTLAIAVDALGKENVHALVLPSKYTSEISMQEAAAVIKNAGVSHEIISIDTTCDAFYSALDAHLAGKKAGITEENIQARCRGVIMMAASNMSGKIVLTTGNRSELAVGYATLYGDMAGGLNVLKDVPKTLVYELARYRNTVSDVIPERTITREPTAELAPDQKDSDTLPPYEILDKILEFHIDHALGIEEIIAQGFERETVERVIKMVKLNEYKRHQAPIGIRVHLRAFGRDRRYPVTSGYT